MEWRIRKKEWRSQVALTLPEKASQHPRHGTKTAVPAPAGLRVSLTLKAAACEFKSRPIHFQEHLTVICRKPCELRFVSRIPAKPFLRVAIRVQYPQKLLECRRFH